MLVARSGGRRRCTKLHRLRAEFLAAMGAEETVLPNLNLDALIFLHRQFVSNPQVIHQMGLVRRLPCGSACPRRKVGEASRFALA